LVGNRILNKNWYSYRCLVGKKNKSIENNAIVARFKKFWKINVKIFEPANEDGLKNNILNSNLNNIGVEDQIVLPLHNLL